MVEYPSYMQTMHGTWLTAVDAAITGATNPYTGLVAYNPASDISAMASAITTFQGTVVSMVPTTDMTSIFSGAIGIIDTYIDSDTYISDRISEHADDLDNEVEAKIIPRFEAGMRDINAVQTSAYALGKAIIEKDRNDKVDKFAADLRLQLDSKRADLAMSLSAEMTRIYLQRREFERVVATLILDERRLAIAAQNDYNTETKAIASDYRKWTLETYKYGANMMASIGGGVTSSIPMDGNKTARIIGSGLSGAAAGAMIGASTGYSGGAGWGAAIGGIAGILAGL